VAVKRVKLVKLLFW